MIIFRTLPLAFISASLVLIGCQQEATVDVETQTDVQAENMSITFDELMALGKNYECSFDHTDEDGSHVKGMVYVEGGGKNLRGTFDVEEGTEKYNGEILHMNNSSYVWTSQQPEGFVMHAEDGTLFGSGNEDVETAVNDEEQFGFNCVPWRVDSSMFDVPQDREFIDIQAQMDAMMGDMGGIEERLEGNGMLKVETDVCAVCDEITDTAAKAQCKSALAC